MVASILRSVTPRDIRERAPQRPSTARKQALQRFHAHAHQGGGLDIPQLLIVAKHDRLALAVWQGLERLADAPPDVLSVKSTVGRRSRIGLVGRIGGGLLAAAPQAVVAE